MSTDTDPAPEPQQPFLKGVFSVYATPGGGYHLAWRPEGAEKDEHVDIPPLLVKMASRGGGPMGMLKALPGFGG